MLNNFSSTLNPWVSPLGQIKARDLRSAQRFASLMCAAVSASPSHSRTLHPRQAPTLCRSVSPRIGAMIGFGTAFCIGRSAVMSIAVHREKFEV